MSTSPAWWANPSNDQYRVWLIELSHNTGLSNAGVVYIATQPYISGSIIYDDWLISPPTIDERLDNPAALGEIEAYNPLNPADWLRYDFIGFSVKCYVGDTRYSKTTFDLCFSGEIESVTHDGNCLFKFAIAESVAKKMQRIYVNDGYYKRGDTVRSGKVPFMLGMINNITPALAVNETAIYQLIGFNQGAITAVDAYFNGQQITVIDGGLFAIGCFGLQSAVSGSIQCNALISDTLTFDAAFAKIMTMCGLTNYQYVNTPANYKAVRVGYYWASDSGATAWDVLQFLVASIHASLCITPTGLVKIIQPMVNMTWHDASYNLITSTISSQNSVADDDIAYQSLKQSGYIAALTAVAIGSFRDGSGKTATEGSYLASTEYSDGFIINRSNAQKFDGGASFSSIFRANRDAGDIVKTMLLIGDVNDPAGQAYRELYYWAVRMANDRLKYTFSVGIDNTLKVGDAVILDFSELGRKFYANVVRRLTNNDGFLSSIEVILEDGEPT